MIQRKTNKADIDRLRPRIFLMTLFAVTTLFYLALQWRATGFSASDLLDKLIEDSSVDIEMLPPLEREHNIVAALNEKPVATDKINKVDEVTQEEKMEQLKEQMTFSTSEADGADKMKASEAEPIAPAITDMNNNEVPLRVVEQLPEFPGGMVEFMKWLTTALKYPRRAKDQKQQGFVKVSFVIEKDGSMSNLKFLTETHTALDAEVRRVLTIMPKWKPGHNEGKPCRTVVAIPFVFAL